MLAMFTVPPKLPLVLVGLDVPVPPLLLNVKVNVFIVQPAYRVVWPVTMSPLLPNVQAFVQESSLYQPENV